MKTTNTRFHGALIGFGFISSRGHLPAFLSRRQSTADSEAVEIVAIADISAERRALAAKLHPGVRVYSDHETLLEMERGRIDFVDIATPPNDHARIAHAALERGLHVLCEKPLTTTLDEARALLDHAERARRVIFPVHNYKHAPVVKAVRDIIRSGKLGKIRSLTLNTFRNTHAKGVPEWNTHWRRDKSISGGGIAMDHGSHTFYLTFDWMGAYPRSVTAKMSTLDSKQYDTEDQFSAVLTFPEGVAQAALSWTAGVRKVLYAVQGERGAITVDDDALELAIMESTSGEDVAQGAVRWNVERRRIHSDWMDASHVQWFNSLFDDFQRAVANGEWVSREARDAYRCVEIITQSYRSAHDSCRELELSRVLPWDKETELP